MKQTGMLVVSLRGVNFGFWSRLGCSEQIANILCHQGLVQGSAKKHRITRRETEVKFFKFSFQIKAFDDYAFISLKLIACRIFVFLNSLFQGSKFAQATPRWSPLGAKFKISNEHPRLFHMGVPTPGRQADSLRAFLVGCDRFFQHQVKFTIFTYGTNVKKLRVV